MIFDEYKYQPLSLWERIVLKFIPEQKAEDVLNDGLRTIVYFKKWRGKIYVMDIISHFSMELTISPPADSQEAGK